MKFDQVGKAKKIVVAVHRRTVGVQAMERYTIFLTRRWTQMRGLAGQ